MPSHRSPKSADERKRQKYKYQPDYQTPIDRLSPNSRRFGILIADLRFKPPAITFVAVPLFNLGHAKRSLSAILNYFIQPAKNIRVREGPFV
nr:hypothetical protein [Micromonospora veneta]